MQLINIGIAGCLGRMGRELVKYSISDPRLLFSGGFEHSENKFINKKFSEILSFNTDLVVSPHPEEVFSNSDVVIDFTTPESSLLNISMAEKTTTPLVIGTTGLNQEILKKMRTVSNNVAVLHSSNMSLAVNILFNLVKKTSSALDEKNYDAEISEIHHKHKIDAPSGTAITLGECVSEGRNKNFEKIKNFGRTSKPSKRIVGEIGFSVTRGGEIPGEHTVSFIGENDRIDLTHKAYNRDIFVKGAIEAAIFLSRKKSGLFSMSDIIN